MPSPTPKANILIVDDTPANLNLLGEILEQAGYKVRKAPNGSLALSSVQMELPDLILLDIKMPGIDGYEVCKQLKADEKTQYVPIIFISALQETRNKLLAFNAGGVDYITKPFQSMEVLARVETHTKLHAMQKELTQAKKEAETANLTKSSFLANMSHEIRTPMNAIINFTALCQQKDLPDKEKDYLNMVALSSQSLLKLINDILDFSKIEAGRLKLETIPFYPENVIKKVISCMQIMADTKHLDLKSMVSSSLPAIDSDPLRLEQIFTNLVSNAIKFTAKGSITILAECTLQSDQEIILCFTVRDSGIGMDEETIAHLFNSFYQAERSTARHFGGTGLGLSISQQLAELMGGEIRVESELGRGSSFIFTASFKPASKQPDKLEGNGTPSKLKNSLLDPIRKTHILIVEDILFNQILIKEILSRENIQVDIADNGKEAVSKASSTRYDCILMDVQMPIMDGYDATREIRKNGVCRKCPIIAMTANAMQGDQEKCLAAGMDDYLTKPLVPNDLFSTLLHWIPASVPDAKSTN